MAIRRPRPGDRLPDAQGTRDGHHCSLHEALEPAAFSLLLAGPADSWDEPDLAALAERHGALLTVVRLDRRPGPGILCSEAAMARLHVSGVAHFVVRPDDHVGYRADNNDLGGAQRYLARWLVASP